MVFECMPTPHMAGISDWPATSAPKLGAPLIAWAIWIGIYPKPYFDVLERPVAQIVERVRPGYYAEHKLINPLSSASPAASLR